ncbi:MAG: long-chain fatty acid transport protein [Halieaceae bacterium]|jgi:long-chain fatty acid transport protein
MSTMNRITCAVVSFYALTISTGVFATNGYLTHGLGTKNKGMAGAGTASPSEAMSVANNPAAAVMLGSRFDTGLSIFSPARSYETSSSLIQGQFGSFTVGPDSSVSKNNFFPIPYAASVWELEGDRAWAAAFYGRGGMNTEFIGGTASFDPDGPGPGPTMTLPGAFGAGTLGVDLVQAFLDLTYSGKTDSLNWGVTAVLAIQSFEARGVANFAGFTETFALSGGTQSPANLSNNGHEYSYGYGFKAGVIWEASDTLNLGLSYQTKTKMTDLDDYADLFAEGGGFDIPASARVGISWRATDAVSLHLDWEHVWYSEVDSIGNSIAGIIGCPTAGFGGTDASVCLGGENGIGFGWDDMSIVKFGVEWTPQDTPEWTMRAGYSQGDQPIPEEELLVNILAPAVMEEHFTVGFTRNLNNDKEFSISFMFAPSKKLTGPSTFDPTQTISIEMEQFELEFGYTW